ncbi:glutathione S-transferase family protein [Bradyrhizobium sp. INPA01-394B]|uniref:Glutathione S-transferase family protein n=1 Tax=Bradyrhizobium campsiandrae TaxID=1729892 RepID=A0ABR7UK13_9BRAD|nr:glutathione S-transferase family protein [Bradyrhizobium campsiandrae]MBC9883162.1 glutathione S-transferase family protein [Bradyrhizobium campsiandrae]MBC9984187.1 glutathione S-transferase family protein [Bradyrhizobium campsiandrae]
MTNKPILWGVGTPRTLRTHWALHELELPYACRPILPRSGETKTAEYTALNIRQKIPLLQDEGRTIGESAVIVAYLAQKYRGSKRSLIPEGTDPYTKWLEWCFFIVAELDSASLNIVRRHGTKHGLAHIYGYAPEVVEQASKYFQHQLAFVDVALKDGRDYLMGDQFTTADILLASCLIGAVDFGVEICDSAMPYLERVTSRNAYRSASKANCTPVGAPAVREPSFSTEERQIDPD